jgi:hypothetical protein
MNTPSERHKRLGELIAQGMRPRLAMRQAGFSESTAKKWAEVARRSRWIRQQIEDGNVLNQVREVLKAYLSDQQIWKVFEEARSRNRHILNRVTQQPRAPRKSIARFLQKYRGMNNTETRNYHRSEAQASTVSKRIHGEETLAVRCSVCHGPVEGRDLWCPNCQRCER